MFKSKSSSRQATHTDACRFDLRETVLQDTFHNHTHMREKVGWELSCVCRTHAFNFYTFPLDEQTLTRKMLDFPLSHIAHQLAPRQQKCDIICNNCRRLLRGTSVTQPLIPREIRLPTFTFLLPLETISFRKVFWGMPAQK